MAGWIKRGASGLTGTNRGCAKNTVEALLEDACAGRLTTAGTLSAEEVAERIAERVGVVVSHRGWQVLDAHERGLGKPAGRPRVKMTRVATCLAWPGTAEPYPRTAPVKRYDLRSRPGACSCWPLPGRVLADPPGWGVTRPEELGQLSARFGGEVGLGVGVDDRFLLAVVLVQQRQQLPAPGGQLLAVGGGASIGGWVGQRSVRASMARHSCPCSRSMTRIGITMPAARIGGNRNASSR